MARSRQTCWMTEFHSKCLVRLARSRCKIQLKRLISLMLCCVDPPVPSTAHALMSLDLQAALGTIQQGADERLEILKDRKRQLEMGEVEMKPKLIGHVDFDESSESQKKEVKLEEPAGEMEGKIPCKRRVTQSVVALKDAKRKENVAKQEQRWIELTEGRRRPTASASLGAPIETTTTLTMMSTMSSTASASQAAPTEMTTTSTVMSTVSSAGSQDTVAAAISSTTEGDAVDLEAAMMSQGDNVDEMYGKKYQTTSEDRTNRSAVRAKQNEEREKLEKE